MSGQSADYDVPDPLPKNWLREEIERARARSAQIPKWARPVVTRRRITPIPPASTEVSNLDTRQDSGEGDEL